MESPVGIIEELAVITHDHNLTTILILGHTLL